MSKKFPQTINGIEYKSKEELDARIKSDLEQLAHLVFDIYQWQKSMDKRLEQQPEGFSFASEGRMCSVCLGGTSGELWYDKLGIRCLDCQQAYVKKIIPGYVIKDHENRRYITGMRLSINTGLRSQQLKKLIKSGELKARIIEHSGTSDTMIFLKSENPSLIKYFSQR